MPQDSHEPVAVPGSSLWKWIAWVAAILVGLWVTITAVDQHRMEQLRTEVESRGGRLDGMEFPPDWYLWLVDHAPTDWLELFALKFYGNFRRVVAVRVPPGTSLPPQFISRLTRFRHITVIDLPDCRLTDFDLEGLSKFTELKSLNLQRNPVTDKGFAPISKLSSLEIVLLNDTRVGDPVLRQTLCLPNLKKLDLSRTNVTDAGFSSLGPQPAMTVLSFNGCAITDQGLGEFDDVHFPMLTSLNLSDSRVTSDGISRLRLGRLQSFSFPDVSMTDEHWRGLLEMKCLYYLNWGDMWLHRVTDLTVPRTGSRQDSFVGYAILRDGRHRLARDPILRFPQSSPPEFR